MVYMIFLFVFVLIIWFNTEAFVEYSHLLKLKWFKVNDYLIAKESDFTLTYHSYLLQKHNNFFTRLITSQFLVDFNRKIYFWLFVYRNTYYLCNIINYIFYIQ